MSDAPRFALTLDRLEGFAFQVRFDREGLPPLVMDEPPPLGKGQGPAASMLLGAAVGNCLSASLLFCVQRSRQTVRSLHTEVEGTLRRNEAGRWRVHRIDVHILLDVEGGEPKRTSRCLELFEDYCVVTASVRRGIQVNVRVTDPEGNVLLEQEGPASGT